MFKRLAIPEVILVTPKAYPDIRGYVKETWSETAYAEPGIPSFVLELETLSYKAGTLRGLHYQLDPFAQGKFVRASAGSVFDVAIDIRVGSPTYKQWVGAELSEENGQQLWVPPGFAHGFITLEDNSKVMYRCSESEYQPQAGRSILWSDPDIAIRWPILPTVIDEKDRLAPTLALAENNFVYDPAG